jgi:hypothetical protein
MDVQPQDINPAIVEIAKVNPLIKEIFNVYLHEVPVVDDRPMEWREALEMMVVKLAEQYTGALEGWKNDVSAGIRPMALVNEKPCPECATMTWFIDEEGVRKCAVCDARKGRRAIVLQKQLLKRTVADLIAGRDNNAVRLIQQILKLEPHAAE